MAVSLNLPMILAKSRKEGKDFYEVLDHYLEMIRNIHIRTYDYLGEMRASCNPLAYCMGGFYGGHLNFTDKIKPVLKSATASFGITALNELQQLYNKKSLVEDGQFALEVMQYISEKINQFKKEDGHLYAIYGTPGENLCFSGDTLIQTYRGNIPIKDVVPGDLVYSFNEDKHKVELKKVLASQMTNPHAVVVKVKFDNGQEEICTPNHPIAVRVSNFNNKGFFTGESIQYIPAGNLKPGMRIKSNYITINAHGRHMFSNYYNGKHQLMHIVNAEYSYGKEIPDGYVVHHDDENKLNNSFDNLIVMTDADHRRLHLKDTIERYQYSSGSQIGEKNSFYGKHHSEEAKLANRHKHMGSPVFAVPMKDKVIAFANDIDRIVFECIQDVKKLGFTEHLARLACRGENNNSHFYKGYAWFYEKDILATEANHKVISVEFMEDLIPVYNIEVEDNHNYFVGGNNGILVHNCGLQVKQFRKIYGIIENVSDRDYVSNSFHCHVTENIAPTQKQDLEYRFWNYFNGGKIQYVRYHLRYNLDAIKTLVERAMKMGFYEGVNLSMSFCNDCGEEFLDADECPKCHSKELTKIDRMNGYLAYSRVHGYSRLSDAKMKEVVDRVSM